MPSAACSLNNSINAASSSPMSPPAPILFPQLYGTSLSPNEQQLKTVSGGSGISNVQLCTNGGNFSAA
ncbi:hypothetical protein ACP70R_023148 [Stipagrostis hirtigluma subsp. patula]